jgi:hypothetical protein
VSSSASGESAYSDFVSPQFLFDSISRESRPAYRLVSKRSTVGPSDWAGCAFRGSYARALEQAVCGVSPEVGSFRQTRKMVIVESLGNTGETLS